MVSNEQVSILKTYTELIKQELAEKICNAHSFDDLKDVLGNIKNYNEKMLVILGSDANN